MAVRRLLVFLVCAACKDDVQEVCAGRDDAACESTPGCHLGLAQPVYAGELSGFACWSLERVVAECVPDLADDRCPKALVKAAPPGGAPCLLFDTTCTPEGWGTCTEPPEIAVCPECESDALPRFIAPDLVMGGAADFGRAVAAGDLDGDGLAELVVGARDGLVVIQGPLTGASTRLRVWTGDPSTDEELVAQIGDVTGDGIGDLVVGSPSAQRVADTARVGGVWVVEGPLVADVRLADAQVRLEGFKVGDELGAAVHVADLDGDGTDDVVAWARHADGAEASGGALKVWYGPVQAGVFRADSADGSLGGHTGFGGVVEIGERDGQRVLVAATAVGLIGEVALPFTGDVSVDDIPSWTLASDSPTPTALTSIALGDVDGDGATDLVWTTDGAPTSLGGAGSVLVSAGPPPAAGSRWATTTTLRGRCGGDDLGRTVAVSDVDGDGADDLLLGATGTGDVAGLLRLGPLAAGASLGTDGAARLGAGLWTAVVVADLDDDGAQDLVVTDAQNTTLRLWWDVAAK